MVFVSDGYLIILFANPYKEIATKLAETVAK
jgi:hypothetical protein